MHQGTLAALFLCWAVAGQLSSEPLPAPGGWPAPDPAPQTPGPRYDLSVADIPASADAPAIGEHSADAAPGQSFFLCGHRFGDRLAAWGRSASSAGGERIEAGFLLRTDRYATVRIADRAFDGPIILWIGNDAGWSRPIRLNVPDPWWCYPADVHAGEWLRVFGRDLARRPDRSMGHVYLLDENGRGGWLEVQARGKYQLRVQIPNDASPGTHQLWVHAGIGGRYAWGAPLSVRIRPPATQKTSASATARDRRTLTPAEARRDPTRLQRALDALGDAGGGRLQLTEGIYPFVGTLRVPPSVAVSGAGAEKTRLQLVYSENTAFARIGTPGWNQAPGHVHTKGDELEYDLRIPAAGTWIVWVRYATEMSPWNQPGVSGNMTLRVGDEEPVLMTNLPNTGSFGAFHWSQTASLNLKQGAQRLIWRNVHGGGIALDAFVLTRDPHYTPADQPFPESADTLIVIQGENCVDMRSRDGTLPGFTRSAVWLAGDESALFNLSVFGSPQVSTGILVRHREALRWIRGCRIENCRVADVEGKNDRSAGIRFERAESVVVRDNEIQARAPIFLQGIRRSEISRNRLIPVTRYGNNALAAILGRCDTIEECVIEGNRVGSPAGADAGGPQVMRMIWVATGHGSVTRNWFAENGVTNPQKAGAMRFGGVAGHNQNVGEVILFEANHRTMYFGILEDADAQSIILPEVVPPTPDERLGSVKREQLAHDPEGNETPFWPPDEDDGTPEPPIHEYYVSIMNGIGHGQTRRIIRREGRRLVLERPWRLTPTRESTVAVETGYYRNLIVDNQVPDGMSGIQLWISCMENIAAGNTVERMRRPAFFLYANGTTLASSMPRTWNRGISPLFFNMVEGNRTETCSAGALVTSGDYSGIPIEFPRALGNVIRHNSFLNNRTQGVTIRSRKGAEATEDPAPSIVGTLVEYNLVRDAPVAFHASYGSAHTIFHRNHAYFWHPYALDADRPAAFQIDGPDSNTVLQNNIVEGRVGETNPAYVERLRAPVEP